MELCDEALHVLQRGGLLLADGVRREAALAAAQAHGAAGRVKADADLARRANAVVKPAEGIGYRV